MSNDTTRCTCPSGDGSLRWPCPAHPPEAQPQDIGPEWKPCRKRPVIVHVREQRPGEQHVSTREGITAVKPDDLIMRGVEGEEYPIGRELFAKTCDLVEAQAQPTPIGDLLADYEANGCDFTDLAWVRSAARGYVKTMPDSQVRCLLHVLAQTTAEAQAQGGGVEVAGELRPCPFCGAPAERIDFGPGDAENEGGSCISCTQCQSSGPVEFGRKENFVSNWNRRTTPPSAPVGVDAPLSVFSAGTWTYETGQAFSADDLDGAAFAVYRPYLAPQPPAEAQAQGGGEFDKVIENALRHGTGMLRVEQVPQAEFTTPTSTPVEVEALVERGLHRTGRTRCRMRIQTIHRNPMGDVFNECSAQGFRITNAEGNSITVTVEGDQINIEGDPFVTGYHNGKISALRMIPNGISGKKATGVIIDELTPATVDGAIGIERARTLIEYVVGYARSAELKPLSSDACVALRDLHAILHAAPPSAPVGVEGLHPETADLVRRFAHSIAEKLAEAERKYGWDTHWKSPAWMDQCREQLVAHVAKGDPRDVAAYCAFLWHHGEPTALAQQPAAVDRGAKFCYQCAARVTWLADDSRCSRCTRLTPDEIIGDP